MNRISVALSLMLVVLFGFAALAQDTAQLRVAHLSPDAPAVDIWVNGERTLTDVPFQALSDYLSLPAGEYRIQVSPAGQTDPIVIDATVALEAGTAYTVAATGLLGADDLSPVVLVDDRAPAMDQAEVRFVHASPDAPAVDVAVAGGPVLFENVSFREAGAYLGVEPGSFDLEVRLSGTDTVALSVPGVTLQAGKTYTVFAIGLAGNDTLAALPAVDGELAAQRAAMDRNGLISLASMLALAGALALAAIWRL